MADKIWNADEESFHSHDCEDFWLDGPADTTVRPCSPSLLPYMTAMRDRERMLQAEAERARRATQNEGQD